MPRAVRDPLELFAPPTRAWFRAALGEPTAVQARGWPPIARGESALLLAPTGSGKTLAAFLSAIDRLAFAEPATPAPPRRGRGKRTPASAEGVRVLYVSPLKALAVDVERNLRAPLAGVMQQASLAGVSARPITVGLRTGDTPPRERERMRKHPPDVLITTPESLYLLLTSEARHGLASVRTVIVDEIHQLVSTKRGAHLMVSLERLEALRPAGAPALQRVGLSATQRPLEEVARMLGGYDDDGAPRPVSIVDAGRSRPFELCVSTPDVDLARLGDHEDTPAGEAEDAMTRRSIWPHLHRRVVELIRAHRSTMVFVNSRRLAERLASAVNDLAGEEIALAHHGSVAREKRAFIEDRLKRGDLPAIVATSSLELGIDMGAVDLVLQIEAPPSIASGLQRIGRASHQVGGVPEGVLFPKHRGDLLACAAASEGMREGAVEETRVLENALDVLAQQVVAMVAVEDRAVPVAEVLAQVRRAAPFARLPRSAFEGVLDMLAGRYPSDAFAELRPRVTWDRLKGTLRARPGARRLAITSGGTIPDRGLYGVFLATGDEERGGKRVGELDEEMVFEMREGDVFLLGASSWRADTITSDRVLVTPAAGEPGRMPFWHGDRAGRSFAFGRRVGGVARAIDEKKPAEAMRWLAEHHHLDASAAENLVRYVADQRAEGGAVPTDRTVVIERFVDEVGDLRVCILTPFGIRVHAPWAMAVLGRLRAAALGEPDVVWSDDGIAFRITATTDPPRADVFLPRAEEVEELVSAALGQSSLFAARFREAAARALLLPRRAPGRRSPLWAQRKRSADLLAVASGFPSFPIVLEAYRECLRDVFDLPALRDVLRRVETRSIRVSHVESTSPSPFCASLLFSFVANFIYDGDAPLAERRAHALAIDHAQLKELLGEAELRQLFDEKLVAAEERLRLRLDVRVTTEDALADLLRELGDLTRDELALRSPDPRALDALLAGLGRDRRVARVRVAGQERFIAAEDAARYRDGVGAVPPPGLPGAFLEPVARPLVELAARYARTHGPFTPAQVAARLGVSEDRVTRALEALVADGRVVPGAFLPQGTGTEYCGKDVLASLRRKALAALRKEVEPVDGPTFARFLAAWQGAAEPARGADALATAIAQLEGAPLMASALETDVLPARVAGYRPGALDALVASGLVVWAGVSPVGAGDGRVALYLAEHEALLSPAPREAEGELPARIRALLGARGALFFGEIARQLGGYGREIEEALWDMIWSGELTNDTLEPLRALTRAAPDRRNAPRAAILGALPRAAALGGTPGMGGRFSLRAARWDAIPTDTQRRAAVAQALLERHGVVVRDAADGLAGGFSAVYDVYKALEGLGRVRRAYFVQGLGGAQFALPEAAERLRAMRTSPGARGAALWLAATDPANPYGALLPWPAPAEDAPAKPQRAAGAHVILHDGALRAWAARGGESLLTFLPEEEPARGHACAAVARALASRVDAGRRRVLLVETVDRRPAAESPLAPYLAREGFVLGARGFMKRGRAALGDDPARAFPVRGTQRSEPLG